MYPHQRSEGRGVQLPTFSVRLRPERKAQLDLWAIWLAKQNGGYRSRGRAVEHLLELVGDPPKGTR